MKILFLTTFNVPIQYEHYFTKNVWKHLRRYKNEYALEDGLVLSSIILDGDGKTYIEERNDEDEIEYQILHINRSGNHQDIVAAIADFFKEIAPDVIHSNMIEGFDIETAKQLGIPICHSVHIGGLICPRGGGDGFLRYDDSICNQPVSEKCAKCMARRMPLSGISYALFKMTPNSFVDWMWDRLNRNIFYLTPFLRMRTAMSERKRCIELLKYTTIIAANKKFVNLLSLNGLHNNVLCIPHGVEERIRLSMPPIKGKVKLYYLGRIQYSKGLHVLLQALKGLDTKKYELHVIGYAGKLKEEQRYWCYVQKLSEGINVHYHGEVKNHQLEQVVKDFHVMIHPAIYLEIYGLSIAESLSMGRPVLASRCGGSEEQVIDGVNGWLVDPNNVQQLHDKIEYLLDNQTEIMKASENAKLPHPIDDYVSKLWNLYKELYNNRSV